MSDTNPDLVEAERVIPASADTIFDLLADPAQHTAIDGSGAVRGARPKGPARLSQGAKFGMDMRIGVPYRVTNTVVEFDEGRRIAWRHFSGHTWRWILEPLGMGSTRVTEQFDVSTARAPWLLKLARVPERNRRSMEKSLDRLEQAVAGRP